jgi:hypothetical protein
VAGAVHESSGLRTAFHAHCAGFVETSDETARVVDLTCPEPVGPVLDSGHYPYDYGQNAPYAAVPGLEQFGERVWHVDFKDCEPEVALRARREGWDYFRAIREGVFCELGEGRVGFSAVVDWPRARLCRLDRRRAGRAAGPRVAARERRRRPRVPGEARPLTQAVRRAARLARADDDTGADEHRLSPASGVPLPRIPRT